MYSKNILIISSFKVMFVIETQRNNYVMAMNNSGPNVRFESSVNRFKSVKTVTML